MIHSFYTVKPPHFSHQTHKTKRIQFSLTFQELWTKMKKNDTDVGLQWKVKYCF